MAVGFLDEQCSRDFDTIGLLKMKDAKGFATRGIPEERGAEWIHYYLRSKALDFVPNNTAPNAAAVEVIVNQGRWVVECPDCNGAQMACRTDPRFLCDECGNIAVGNLWRPVVWPDDVDGIEDALGFRSDENQNWYPGETVDDLRAEAVAHTGGS